MSVLILKDFRDKQGVSREEQSDILGITINTLNTWEYRNKKIPNSKLQYVINKLNTYVTNKGKNIISIKSDLPKKVIALEKDVETLKDKVATLKENFKMVYDQLLFLQNSWIASKKDNDNSNLG